MLEKEKKRNHCSHSEYRGVLIVRVKIWICMKFHVVREQNMDALRIYGFDPMV